MLEPAYPICENLRLTALHELRILDTPAEERFDRITRLARRVFDVPMALVSLVDAERQWFKSKSGIDAVETPRSISFCGHAILEPDIMEVPDALLDPRFFDNPFVTADPFVRYYAGCPLRASNGQTVGTLCLIDTKPRLLTAEDRRLLHDLASTVELEMSSALTAVTDPLTQLSNRRGLLASSGPMLRWARRTDTPLYTLLFDLDGFKQINDQQGHAAGDRALVEFGQALKDTFRNTDVVVRLGGDEFCVIMVDSTSEGPDAALARLDERLDTRASELPFSILYSAGRVKFDPELHPDLSKLLEAADHAMYREKRRRRAATIPASA